MIVGNLKAGKQEAGKQESIMTYLISIVYFLWIGIVNIEHFQYPEHSIPIMNSFTGLLKASSNPRNCLGNQPSILDLMRLRSNADDQLITLQ